MAGKDFICLNNKRIRISTIKSYQPLGDLTIVLRFSSDPNNKKSETYKFEDTDKRNAIIIKLDSYCLL